MQKGSSSFAGFMTSQPIRRARLIWRLSCDPQARTTARAASQLRWYAARSSVLTTYELLLASAWHHPPPIPWDHDRFISELKQAAGDSSQTPFNNP